MASIAKRAKEFTVRQALRTVLRMLPYISDETLLAYAESRLNTIEYPEARTFMEHLLLQGKRALSEACPACRNKGAANFFVNSLLSGWDRRQAFKEQEGFYPPYFFVISPTTRCNLSCFGCYAGKYGSQSELSHDLVRRILNEARDIGIFFLTISGGEPFVWPPLLDIFTEFHDIYFQVYTNGTLLDDRLIGKLAELGNVLPCVSVEGFEAETDSRRGPGTFRRVTRVMRALKEAGVIFGFSATATRQNNDLVVSDEFLRYTSDLGCFIGWYFSYIPVGRGPDLELMPTPEQREYRRARLEEVRYRYPMMLADFWNDGPLIGSCIAGGTSYFHVNARGDCEPCVFVHFAVDNIRDKSLTEVLRSPFFRDICRAQPYHRNLLRPCMVIDNPWVLRTVVSRHHARPTHTGAEDVVTELASFLDDYARRWAAIADRSWYRDYSQGRAQAVEANAAGAPAAGARQPDAGGRPAAGA
jgi:MoaA/NifB/PqqE/SkfB family radical SAM enzyme